MNYKKISIFLTLILGVAAFYIAENRFESFGSPAKQKVYQAADKREISESDKIAVINLDEGVSGSKGRVNYGEKLSRFPSTDFEYASLEAARMGLETGRYGAYVIIPATFSQNVESINTAPQVSKLEYAVNQSFSGKRQYELLYKVWSYIDSLNNHLSYMYVENILREFHNAQDQAERVVENDLKDMEAMERIEAQEWVTLADTPQMPVERAVPETLDISDYTEQTAMLAESMDEQYGSGIQSIQEEIALLSAGKTALAEGLKGLAGRVGEINLSVDENGEEIAGKAEVLLREELARQSEHMLEKESLAERLNKFRDKQEEFLRHFEQISRSCPSRQEEGQMDENQQGEEGQAEEDIQQKGNEAVEETDETRLLLSMLTEQKQELDSMLGELEQAENLDIESITELVRAEYVKPMEANADKAKKEFQQRYEDELQAVSEYEGQLAAFHPQMDGLFLAQSIQQLKENHRNMQGALLKNNQAYIEYAQKSAADSREYADSLHKHIEDAKQEAKETIAQGLSLAKEVKEKNSAMNQRILGSFSSKLSYTRLGGAEHTRVYQFIANPLRGVDRSGTKAEQ